MFFVADEPRAVLMRDQFLLVEHGNGSGVVGGSLGDSSEPRGGSTKPKRSSAMKLTASSVGGNQVNRFVDQLRAEGVAVTYPSSHMSSGGGRGSSKQQSAARAAESGKESRVEE